MSIILTDSQWNELIRDKRNRHSLVNLSAVGGGANVKDNTINVMMNITINFNEKSSAEEKQELLTALINNGTVLKEDVLNAILRNPSQIETKRASEEPQGFGLFKKLWSERNK